MTRSLEPSHSSSINVFVIRLKPHEDLKASLQKFSLAHQIKAAIILSCVGSLEQYNLRFANAREASTSTGFFEIVSLTGTLSESSCHLHMCIADEKGMTVGGHLMEGNQIYTTAEIAIGILPELIFTRMPDDTYGYQELHVSPFG